MISIHAICGYVTVLKIWITQGGSSGQREVSWGTQYMPGLLGTVQLKSIKTAPEDKLGINKSKSVGSDRLVWECFLTGASKEQDCHTAEQIGFKWLYNWWAQHK